MHPTSHRPAASPLNGSTTMSVSAGQEHRHQPAHNDVIVVAAGGAVFIASFLPWFGISLGFFSATQNAWHSLLGIAPVLLATAVAAAVAAETYAGFRLPVVRNRQPRAVLAAASGTVDQSSPAAKAEAPAVLREHIRDPCSVKTVLVA